MAKKKEENTLTKALIPIIIFLVIWQGINVFTIEGLKDEIALMPHYECWNETDTYEVILSLGNNTFRYSHETKDRNSNVMCEEGVVIYETWINDNKMVANYDLDIKRCMIREVVEVCRLNKHDVLLGVNE